MIYQHPMAFLGTVVTYVLDVFNDEVFATSLIVVVENAIGLATHIYRCEFQVLRVDESGYFYPLSLKLQYSMAWLLPFTDWPCFPVG